VRDRSLLEAIASSLTELFSPTIISERVSGMLRSYSFVTPETLAYFTPRLTQAPRDSDFALAYVKDKRAHGGTAGRRTGCLKLQMRRALVAARCAAFRLRGARIHSPGAFDPGPQERVESALREIESRTAAAVTSRREVAG